MSFCTKSRYTRVVRNWSFYNPRSASIRTSHSDLSRSPRNPKYTSAQHTCIFLRRITRYCTYVWIFYVTHTVFHVHCGWTTTAVTTAHREYMQRALSSSILLFLVSFLFLKLRTRERPNDAAKPHTQRQIENARDIRYDKTGWRIHTLHLVSGCTTHRVYGHSELHVVSRYFSRPDYQSNAFSILYILFSLNIVRDTLLKRN